MTLPEEYRPAFQYVVVRTPWGESSFTGCEADEFATGILTITALESDTVSRVFRPLQWQHATVYDGHQTRLYGFVNSLWDRSAWQADLDVQRKGMAHVE